MVSISCAASGWTAVEADPGRSLLDGGFRQVREAIGDRAEQRVGVSQRRGFFRAQHDATSVATLANLPIELAFRFRGRELRRQGLATGEGPALRFGEGDVRHTKQPPSPSRLLATSATSPEEPLGSWVVRRPRPRRRWRLFRGALAPQPDT